MSDPSSVITGGQLLAVVVLVLANGFFVAAEFSLVAMRRSRVQQLVEEGHPLAPALERAMLHLDAYLAATQLGITMASIGLGWIGEPALAGLIGRALRFLPEEWEVVGAEVLAIVAAFGLITVLHIVLGELAPKSLALQRTERTALITVRPLELFLLVFRPAILALNGLGNRTLRLFGLEPGGGEGTVHSVEELQLLVAASRGAGLVSDEAEDIVERAFKFDDLTARQVMVPRVEIVSVRADASPRGALALAVESHRTHLPVRGLTIDEIVGVVNVLDLLQACDDTGSRSVGQVMRPPLQVPQTMRADVLLAHMRAEGQQLAILIDEYGGTAGLVTVSDLAEELIGPALGMGQESLDEPQADGSILLRGLTTIHDANRRFNLHLAEGEADTVGGLVLTTLGRAPVLGDTVTRDGYRLVVERLDGRRIDRLRLMKAAGAR